MSFPAHHIPRIFNRRHLRHQRNRAVKRLADHDFLLDTVHQSMLDRLDDIRRTFPVSWVAGARACEKYIPALRTKTACEHLIVTDIAEHSLPASQSAALCLQADDEMLPFAPHSFDLALSIIALHSVNDLPGALIQIKRSLKPDGLFLGAMIGGETLYELRRCLTEAEMTLRRGASPRIFPFADKQQMGGLLQRAGYTLPVVDSDIITAAYKDIRHLMRDLQGMGEGNIIHDRYRGLSKAALFDRAEQLYRAYFPAPDGTLTATFEIIYLIGWAPHESQQKPLQPGSAQTRLAEALGARETKI